MPVIGLSARSDISKEKIKSVGFTDFLVKPFTSNRLYNTIWNYVREEDPAHDAFEIEEKQLFEEKGVSALIEFVSDDKETSQAILESFINETGISWVQLQEAFQKKEEKVIQGITHKILPLFRSMGSESLIGIMEKLEKGETLPEEEKDFVLTKIQDYLEEAKFLKKKFEGK